MLTSTSVLAREVLEAAGWETLDAELGPFLEEMMEPREFYNSWQEFCS